MAQVLADELREPRNKRDVVSDWFVSDEARVTFERIELVWDKHYEHPSRLENPITLRQHCFIGSRVLEDLDHCHGVERARSEWEHFN